MTKMMMIKTRKKIRRTETRNITRMMMAKPIKKFVHREKSDMKKITLMLFNYWVISRSF